MWVEATEVLPSGRKRAEEYKLIRALPKDKRGWVHVSDEELAPNHEIVSEVLQDRLRAKSKKNYRDAEGHLITPNMLVRDSLAHDHSFESLARMASPWKDAFSSIWILSTDARLVRLFPSMMEFASRDGIQSLLPATAQPLLKLW